MDPTVLIGDIVEREPGDKKPAEFPTAPASSTGFPQHKRRWKNSAFKQQRAARDGNEVSKSGAATVSNDLGHRDSGNQDSFEDVEKKRIDLENRQKLANMSTEEIAQAQDDIMSGLNPGLIQRLLARANIDEPTSPSPFDPPKQPSQPEPSMPQEVEDLQRETPHIKVEEEEEQQKQTILPKGAKMATTGNIDEDKAPPQIPADLFPITEQPKSTHFPTAPSLPDLDPDDPNFLSTLHDKYFPNLPADPSKLAWMAPIPTKDSVADKDSPYYPHDEIAVSALRFDFRGRFLSPRVSRNIPSTKGLHHHGEAPEAAGYTIAELARLARSAVPAQRCMAYQTLGRILYRLGQGEWGKTVDDPIAMGIWSAVKKGRVMESLLEAAGGEGGHRGSRAYATEALWLFEKGGWKEMFKGR